MIKLVHRVGDWLGALMHLEREFGDIQECCSAKYAVGAPPVDAWFEVLAELEGVHETSGLNPIPPGVYKIGRIDGSSPSSVTVEFTNPEGQDFLVFVGYCQDSMIDWRYVKRVEPPVSPN